MTTVEEIEKAAEQLAPADFDRLTHWINQRHHDLWHQRMETDSAAGKLDFLFDEARLEREDGRLRDWPMDKK